MNTSQAKQIDSYNKIANNYLSWDWTAKALLESANILRKERDLAWQSCKGATFPRTVPPAALTEEVVWMLQAFAIECLLKGLFVKGGNKIAENGAYKGVDGVADNHDLEMLAKHVMGNEHNNVFNVLRKLEWIGKNIGRYPVAKKSSDSKFSAEFSNEKNDYGYDINSVVLTDAEQSLVDTFIKELLRKLTE